MEIRLILQWPGLLLSCLLLMTGLTNCQSKNKPENGTAQSSGPESSGLISSPEQLPDILDYEGEFQQAAQWPGQGSTHYAIISKYQQGEFFSPSWASRLNIYLFELSQGQVISRRAFQAEASNNYSETSLKPGKSKLVNLPSMGQAFSFVYSICPDGEDPCSLFSSVVGQEGKYDFQVIEQVDEEVYRQAEESMMANIPKDIRQHMFEQIFGK